MIRVRLAAGCLVALLALASCDEAESTRLSPASSGAPLNDEAIEPGEEEAPLDDY